MSNNSAPTTNPSQPEVYQIRIKGHLGHQWIGWFEGFIITLEESGNTLLTGPVVDQAALHGLLKKVRDLGLPLISVCPVKPGPQNTPPFETGSRGSGQADAPDIKPPGTFP